MTGPGWREEKAERYKELVRRWAFEEGRVVQIWSRALVCPGAERPSEMRLAQAS